jgi:hypothetical protein
MVRRGGRAIELIENTFYREYIFREQGIDVHAWVKKKKSQQEKISDKNSDKKSMREGAIDFFLGSH